jgi:Dyp-type peroxidase family
MNLDSEPLLETAEIQGKIAPGFARPCEMYVSLRFQDAEGGHHLIRSIVDLVTPMSTAFEQKAIRKSQNTGQPNALGLSNDVFCCAALTADGFRLLGHPEIESLDRAFRIGQFKRSFSLGDPRNANRSDDKPNPHHRDHWVVGGKGTLANMLVILAGESAEELNACYEQRLAPIVDRNGVSLVHVDIGTRLPNDKEHFGFRDGVSQPGMRGTVLENPATPLTTRYVVGQVAGRESGRPGQPLAWPGQFVFGYATQRDTSALEPGPLHPGLPPFTRNGSFMVFRRLNQFVGEFYRDTDQRAAAVPGSISGGDLRTLLVGRQPDGTPLVRDLQTDPNSPSEPFFSRNYFQYGSALPEITVSNGVTVPAASADVGGRLCPLFAHIRKVNPRDRPTDQGPEARTLTTMILRRGIPFGPAYDHVNPNAFGNARERGLLFVCFQTSVTGQFELLQTKWMNRPDRPEAVGNEEGGFDLLVGQKGSGQDRSRSAFLQSADGTVHPINLMSDHVSPTGGLYLFAPSISSLKSIANDA